MTEKSLRKNYLEACEAVVAGQKGETAVMLRQYLPHEHKTQTLAVGLC